jgi:hypothetical protein
VGLFNKRKAPGGSRLPPNIVKMLEEYGHFAWDPPGSGIDGGYVWSTLQSPLVPFSQSDRAGFLSALANAVLPVGGWPAFGAERMMIDLVGGDVDDPNYDSIMTTSLDFLRERGVPNSRLTGYEWQFWQKHEGSTEPWQRGLPAPSVEEATISELQPTELRKVAQLTAEPDSNLIFVRGTDNGGYVSVIDSIYSHEDPRRCQSDWLVSETLHELYQRIGESFQTPTFWYDAELGPYFPLGPPTI